MFTEFVGTVSPSLDSSDQHNQRRIISDPEENPKIPCRDSGDKEDTKKKGLSINEAMEDSVILNAKENPYYEGLRTSHFQVNIMFNDLMVIMNTINILIWR